MLEYLEAMPLLAQEAVYLAPVTLPAGIAPPGARPAPVQRSDSERRAEASWLALPPTLLTMGGWLVLALALLGLLTGLVSRAVRGPRSSP